MSLELLSADSKKILDILNAYHTSYLTKGNIISHYYELFTTSILLKNIEIMHFIISRINLKVEFYFQKTQLNSFYLMCLFYYRLSGDKKNQTKFFKSFKLSDCRHSYKEFINLIFLVYLYNNSTKKSKKVSIRDQYKKLSRKLNYTYFSEDFLLTYFD